jgi:hypothetical protein
MTVRSVGAELIRADRQTDGHNEAFREFANVPENYIS